MNTQAQRLLNHLQQGLTIHRWQAMIDLGIAELSSRCIDLENAGYVINRKRISILNRFNEKSNVVEYSLADDLKVAA